MDGVDILKRALSRLEAGDSEAAETLFHTALEHDGAKALANHHLGLLAYARGDLALAETHMRQAAGADPNNPEHHNNLGVLLNAQGDHAGACSAFEQALRQKPDFVQATTNLGAALEARGDFWGAITAYRRALAIDPGNVEARDSLEIACARTAPPWHFPMVADKERNRAYEAALRKAAPGRHVLEIGTGSGLLAMMAARAGAASVATCEMVPAIAAAARRVIEANGFSGQIALHAKRSDQLRVGPDLPGPAEVLVTETFASGVLSESVLPTLEHARRHLLTPDAQIIPRRASALGYLIGGEAIEGHLFAHPFGGFDLSGFDVFAPNKLGLHLDRVPHDVLSEDFEIFAFDLMQSAFAPERRIFPVRATRAGRCVGVAQWLFLDLDSETTYDNRPRATAGANGWMHVLYRFDRPLELKVGDTVALLASHNRLAMTVALAPASAHV